jgi:hypothetical protein
MRHYHRNHLLGLRSLHRSKLTSLSGSDRQICDTPTAAVISAISSACQSEVEAWEEIAASEHTFFYDRFLPIRDPLQVTLTLPYLYR